MDKELFYLVLRGKIPPEIIDPNLLPPYLQSVHKAVKQLARDGKFPLACKDVWQISHTRYGGKEETHDFLKELETFRPNGTILDSVKDNMVLRRLLQKTTEQLSTGDYNLEELRKLLNVVGDRRNYIKRIQAPGEDNRELYQLKTGIGPIDAVIGGLNAELGVVAARPKNGKSNFFFNLIWKNPKANTVYFTIADYDYRDVCHLLHKIDSELTGRDNLWIVDYTMKDADVTDIESALSDIVLENKISLELIIVDRAEKLRPIRRRREPRWELADTFDGLRRICKKYGCPLLTDSQLSDTLDAKGEKDPTFANMAEDRTGRAATVDLFFGLRRKPGHVRIAIDGRRGRLPTAVTVQTDEIGRYMI